MNQAKRVKHIKNRTSKSIEKEGNELINLTCSEEVKKVFAPVTKQAVPKDRQTPMSQAYLVSDNHDTSETTHSPVVS